ncbi:HpcH/HpaI aldolase family protein [Vibrio marisflavi]|uniref:5-keto-4-deoxy-D-glucarate aldolase n=1 Tax=Vibrio marisflavi CECT 7928 TaxID=634439 RepID=A0ABM9A062_9VIBR|nr:aldolase/citrate lyase family protein [Vibrio marisflavi]CAH0536652.1 5-keto-4-deoxy-D-glucarate aldolase [Vibrio marisflavi CECT 7928]
MNFAKQLAKEPLLGTFVKTPHPHIIEVLQYCDLDFLILDAEHSPFDRTSLDLCLMVSNIPTLVRIPDSQPSTILNSLDCGATGILVPHVCSATQAETIVAKCHFGAGGRGYAGSTRAAQYTQKLMQEHLSDSANQTTVVVQIEDIEGVDNVSDIAAVNGVDALFIGQVDLAVAYGESSVNGESVRDASLKIIEVAKSYDKPVGMFVSDAKQIAHWRKLGVSFFGLASEHKMIIDGFKNQRTQVESND